MPYVIQANIADAGAPADWRVLDAADIASDRAPLVHETEQQALAYIASGELANVEPADLRILELPCAIECGAPLAAFRSIRTVLRSGVMTWAGGACRADVELIHKTAGYEVAGSAMRLTGEAWGFIIQRADGTTGGQWFKGEGEARAHYDAKVKA